MRDTGGRIGKWESGGFRKDVDAIRDDISMLKTDLGSAMRDLIDAGKSGADDARKRLQELVGARLETLNDAAQQLSEKSREVFGKVRKRVEEKPVQTAAIAVGVGVVIGLLYFGLRRK